MFFRFVFRGCTGVIAGKLERKQASQRASQPASSQPAGLAPRNWIRNPTKIGEKSLKRFAPSQLPFSELTTLLQLQTSSGCLAACDNCCFFATFFESFIMLLNVNYIWRCKVFSHPFLILAVACSDWINSVRVVSVSFFLDGLWSSSRTVLSIFPALNTVFVEASKLRTWSWSRVLQKQCPSIWPFHKTSIANLCCNFLEGF